MAALADWRQEIEPRPGGSESWHTPAGPRRGSWECEEEGDSCGRSGGQGTVLDVPVGGGFPGPLPATPPSPTLPGPPRKRPQVFQVWNRGVVALFFLQRSLSRSKFGVQKLRLWSQIDRVPLCVLLPDLRLPTL